MGSVRISRAAAGFTLVELLVVLVILGLAMALAGPELGAGLGRLTDGGPAAKLAGALRQARAEAVRLGMTACFELNPGTGEYRITVAEGTADSLLAAGRIGAPVGEATGLSRSCFHPSGMATAGRRFRVPGENTRFVEVDRWDGEVSITR